MKLQNTYLKIVLYGLLASLLIIVIQILLLILEIHHQQFVSTNLKILYFVIPLINYIVILLLNIVLLKRLNLEFVLLNEGTKWRLIASYSSLYLAFILIIVTIILNYFPIILIFGVTNTKILGFNRYAGLGYILLFPFLYYKFKTNKKQDEET